MSGPLAYIAAGLAVLSVILGVVAVREQRQRRRLQRSLADVSSSRLDDILL